MIQTPHQTRHTFFYSSKKKTNNKETLSSLYQWLSQIGMFKLIKSECWWMAIKFWMIRTKPSLNLILRYIYIWEWTGERGAGEVEGIRWLGGDMQLIKKKKKIWDNSTLQTSSGRRTSQVCDVCDINPCSAKRTLGWLSITGKNSAQWHGLLLHHPWLKAHNLEEGVVTSWTEAKSGSFI